MILLRRDTSHPARAGIAQTLGQAGGQFLGAMLGRQQAQGFDEEAAAYVDGAENERPEVFASKLAAILTKHGKTPGPIFQAITSAHSQEWQARQAKVEREAAKAEAERRMGEVADQAAALAVPEREVPTLPTQRLGWTRDVPVETGVDSIQGYSSVPDTAEVTPIRGPEGSWNQGRLFGRQIEADEARRQGIAGLFRLAPEKAAGAVLEAQMPQPEKAEKPTWDSTRGAFVSPDGTVVVPQGLPPKPETPKAAPTPPTGYFWNDPADPSKGVAPLPGYKQPGGDSPLAKLIEDRNALPPDHPDRAIFDAAIRKSTSERGLRIKTNADGSVEVSEGFGGDGEGLAKPTKAAVEKDVLETGKTLQRLLSLEREFNASLQTIGPRLGAWWSSWKSKGGARLSPGEKTQLQAVTRQRRRAFDILNSELNRLSGAAVTEHEMKRLTKGMPNPGTGVFDGDSPEEFQTKMEDSLASIRAAMARLAYVRRKGLSIADVALDDMPDMMNRRGAEILQGLRARRVPEAEAQKQARQMLADEFGLLR